MRNRSRIMVSSIVVASLTAACDGEPRRAGGTAANPVGPSPGAPPVVVNVEISGPASIAPGQSVQFTAVARFSDGTSQTPSSVRWSSSNTALLRVDTSGLVTAGQQTGEATLSADLTPSGLGGATRSSKEILVLPDGTYRVVGVVTDDGTPPTPVAGARIEVTGPTPVVAITDWDGRYRLYGVPGMGDIRVTADGYRPQLLSLQLAEHLTQNFQLALVGMRLDLAGAYSLTVDVECEASVPIAAELRQVSYSALLTQNGATLEVVLTESPRFRVNRVGRGDRFSGRVDAAGAGFRLDDFSGDSVWYFGGPYDPSSYPNVVERLSDGTFLIISGTALTRASPAGLSGDFLGGINHFDSRFLSVPLLSSHTGTCYPRANRFTLTRR